MRVLVLALAAVLITPACDTGEDVTADAGATSSSVDSPVTGSERGALALTASWEPEPLVAGGPATFTVRLANLGDTPREVEFSSGQRAEVELRRDGTVAYRWSDGRVFTQEFGTVTLPAGETLEFSLPAGSLDVEPGSYDLVVSVTGRPGPPPAEIPVVVEGGG